MDPPAIPAGMRTYARAGLSFDVADSGGPDRPAFVLLHGFPQTPAMWGELTPALAAGGYRVLAPALRGYSPGARPPGESAYRVSELVADVVALADAAGLGRFHLVGHDWGGAVAWACALAHPDRLHTLTSVSTPHPGAFAAALRRGPQAVRSLYMAFFRLPALPERVLLAGGGRVLREALVRSGLPRAAAERDVEQLRAPGALSAALNYYRAMRLSSLPGGEAQVRVPTLYVWSTGDRFLGRRAAEDTARWVAAPYRFEVMPGVSHWVPEQRPAELARLLLDHAGGVAGG